MVRRDGVRMENNDSMPDICRRGRDKINSPLNSLWKKKSSVARHKYPKKKKEKKKKCDSSNDVGRLVSKDKDRKRDIFTSGWTFSSKNREIYLAHPFFQFLRNSSTFS